MFTVLSLHMCVRPFGEISSVTYVPGLQIRTLGGFEVIGELQSAGIIIFQHYVHFLPLSDKNLESSSSSVYVSRIFSLSQVTCDNSVDDEISLHHQVGVLHL